LMHPIIVLLDPHLYQVYKPASSEE
jgi:hypothetical protein